MKICIVNWEMTFNNGILSKYANKMKEGLDVLGIENVLSPTPLNGYINHHINYLPYKDNGGVNTLMITHIFEGYKLDRVKEGMKTADCGICMSLETKDFLVSKGIDGNKLEVILPAHDFLPRKKKKIAIVTNVYPDGCKRENMYYELLKFLNKEGIEEFEFQVMGSGWLNADYDKFDHDKYLDILEACDYLLYFGLDEGAMSVLDARQVGLKTIAPLVGFHKEIGIDYPFITQVELNEIFKKLAHNPVWGWSWTKYVLEHTKIWERLR